MPTEPDSGGVVQQHSSIGCHNPKPKPEKGNSVETLTCEMIYKCNLPSLSWTSTRGTNRSPGTESSQLRFLENILVYPSISLFQCTILSVGNYSKQMRSQRERSGRKELED